MGVYSKIKNNRSLNKKMFAVLIDPDKMSDGDVKSTTLLCDKAGVDFIFTGGSLLTDDSFSQCIRIIKKHTQIPVVIFPGNTMQISPDADAILFLSLISGRNADMLIGKHVISAPILKKSGIEVIPTGYMLIESGKLTSVMYMSNTVPIPRDKDDIACCTALAGEMLGLKLLFLDAGSGAKQTVSNTMISKVRKSVTIPIITGGGISKPQEALAACKAGADIIVMGNAIEKNTGVIAEVAAAVHSFKADTST